MKTIVTGYTANGHKHAIVPEIREASAVATGYVVFDRETKERMSVDLANPITLKRAGSLLVDAEAMTGNDYDRITIEALDDVTCETVKKYIYKKEDNSLTIWDKDGPVYQNFNGEICNDINALADCLM